MASGPSRLNSSNRYAAGTDALVIDTGANAVVNTGALEASSSGGLYVNSDLINDGLLFANNGNVSIAGNVSGTGSALIDAPPRSRSMAPPTRASPSTAMPPAR